MHQGLAAARKAAGYKAASAQMLPQISRIRTLDQYTPYAVLHARAFVDGYL
jgi:hypothetical protein